MLPDGRTLRLGRKRSPTLGPLGVPHGYWQPTILATSGGYKPGDRTRLEFNHLMHYAVELSGVAGRAPRVTHIGTASGDQRWWAAEMDQAARIAGGFDFSHLNLFTMPNIEDPEAHLLEQDVIWVNGGSVVNLLAVWRAHGLDGILRKAWKSGVVLAASQRAPSVGTRVA